MVATSKRRSKAGTTSGKSASVKPLTTTQVPKAIERMAAPSGSDRFAAAKALCVTAEKHPARVYPFFDELAMLLGSKSSIIRWNAIRLVALLASVDAQRKLDGVLDEYLASIRGDNLVSAANTIQGIAVIASARPDLHDRLLAALLGVSRANYRTPECRNVAIGEALKTLAAIGPAVCTRPEVARFIRRQRSNPRPSVARQAERLVTTSASKSR